MEQIDYNERRCSCRKKYEHLTTTVKYASACGMLEDAEGERIALKHAIELALDLLMPFMSEGGEECDDDALELDGMREMSREVQDIQEAGAAQEEGAPQAHVVPVVQERDTASGEVLSMAPKEACKDSHHGTNGINPKRGVPRKTFRLYLVDASGEDVKLVDTGTAAEIANKHDGITPKWIYNNAGKQGRAGNKYRVEKVEG